MDAAAEVGRNPVSEHRIQPEHRDEQADAGRDCRIRLARPNSQVRKQGQGKIHFSCSADHEQDWHPNPLDPYPCYVLRLYSAAVLSRTVSATNRTPAA